MNSYTFSIRNSLIRVYNSHVASCLCLDRLLKISPPHSNPHPHPHPTPEKFCCFEMMKLSLKDNFSQNVQGLPKTSVWFVHATDCYCFDRKSFKVSFTSPKKSLLVQNKVTPFWWPTLSNLFGCVYLTDRNTCRMKKLFL